MKNKSPVSAQERYEAIRALQRLDEQLLDDAMQHSCLTQRPQDVSATYSRRFTRPKARLDASELLLSPVGDLRGPLGVARSLLGWKTL